MTRVLASAIALVLLALAAMRPAPESTRCLELRATAGSAELSAYAAKAEWQKSRKGSDLDRTVDAINRAEALKRVADLVCQN